MIPALESIDWHSFLDRPPLVSLPDSVAASLANEPILITGAGGSIGSALAHRLGAAGARLILLEASESNLFDLQSELSIYSPSQPPAFYLGSTSDRPLLEEIFRHHRPQPIFHAAAFKHVPLLEEQPFAAIDNNVIGTRALVTCAAAHGARILLLSTDKAVMPAALMGATKRVAEQIVLAAGGTVLRLANVLGSRGSVADVFARQIATGAPLTVTDPAARRYFLTIAEAVDLLLAATGERNASALFVPQLRATHYIADLARFMARTLAPDRAIPIEFTHLRAGDKEAEALYSPIETPHSPSANGLVPVDSPRLPAHHLRDLLEALKDHSESRDLAAAISVLRRLVPDYTPSRALEAVLTKTEPPVHNV